MTDSAPRTIGRYEILRELGRGMMGVVYEAEDPALHRRVALKTIHLTFVPSPEERESFEQRFVAEARIAARLSHPGIVIVHDVGRDPESGTLFIALEYLEGRTLGEIVKEGPLEWRKALRITGRIAEALHHAHSHGVVHRDIKPANIMILASGEPKIMDFGIAKIDTARMKLTMAGQFFGTPLYMAPEQALDRTVDGRADLFALGAIAYTLLTGQLAFGAGTIPRIISRIVQEDPTPPTRLVPVLPADLDYVIARALAKDPDTRYPNGGMFAEDLEDIIATRSPRHRPGWFGPTPGEGTMVSSAPLKGAEAELDLLLEDLAQATPPTPTAAASGVASPPESLVPAPPERRTATAPRRPIAPPSQTPSAGRAPKAQAGRPGARLGMSIAAGLVALVLAALLLPRLMRRGEDPPASASAPARESSPAFSAVPTPVASTETTEPSAAATPGPPSVAPADPRAESARLAIDFEHPLKSGSLRIWVDGEVVLDEKLGSRVTRKIAAFKLRSGGLEETLELSPGLHDIQAQVAWDGKDKTESIRGRFDAGQTRRLEIRLGRIRKDLSLEWR